MENLGNVLLVIVVIIISFGGTSYYKKKLVNQIADAMTSGDYETYKKLIFSKRAMYFLNPNSLFLMRASHHITLNELEEAEKCLNVIKLKKIPFEQKLNYVQTKSMLAMNKKDLDMHNSIHELLKEMLEEGKNTEVVETLITENNINRKLYFKYEPSVIEDINKQLKKLNGPAKGLLLMSLAKAYHLNDQDKLAVKALEDAKTLLKGTMYKDVIEETINDLSIMD